LPAALLPAAMAPLDLHQQPPLTLPVDHLRDGVDLVDQQWSRRQFSVLFKINYDRYFAGE
jgi:hypothetical protein